jgi:ribosomal protein S18 acetylase RimI-like enzyme
MTAVVRPANDRDACPMARILVEALADEFQIIFGSRLDEARKTMAAEFRLRALGDVSRGRDALEGSFVALEQQELVGLIACCTVDTPQAPFLSLARILWREIGPRGMMRALIALVILRGRPDPDACYIDYLAVRPQWQRQGIGSALLEQAQVYARSQSKRRLTLEVSWRNLGALRLYRRLGFSPVRGEQGHLMDRLFGMPRWLEMEKHLPQTRLLLR